MRLRLTLAYGTTAAIVLAATALGWAAQARGDRVDNTAITWTADSDTDSIMMAAQPPVASTQASNGTKTANDTLPLLRPNPVTIKTTGFWSWALLDTRAGSMVGSANLATAQRTASMIKAWLAADYLRLAAARGERPSTATLSHLSVMIRDSDNDAASDTYEDLGEEASVKRLISICGLTDTRAGEDWAHTLVSARDAVRMGQCIADGRGAGSATWTNWVLTEMRNVRGVGRFGIISALPTTQANQTAIKNGWVTFEDSQWHINCLAIGSGWILAVETVYPATQTQTMSYGASICQSVAKQLMAT
jgi:hypothetical protein